MRSKVFLAKSALELLRVKTHVRPDTSGSQVLATLLPHQRQCGLGFSDTDRGRERHSGDQAMTVVHQRMARKAQLCFPARDFATQFSFWTRGPGARVVAVLLAFEVATPARIGRRAATIFGPKRDQLSYLIPWM